LFGAGLIVGTAIDIGDFGRLVAVGV
jgi:hypothetical protein